MNVIFGIIATVLTIYSLLCFFRIILTWIPEMSYSKAAQFLAGICDPYMNIFRGIKWLRMGSFDFSPALGLCLLGAFSSLFKMLSNGGMISIGMIIAMGIQIISSIISSLLTFIIIVFAVRLLVILMNRNNYNPSSFMLNQLDSSISPLVYRIAKTFTAGRNLTYKTALIISIVSLVAANIIFTFISNILINIVANLPV
ncbi:YggT family protein [Treponema sp.]|uniref:YggT family protein n=1 Tax=Treponema sp. TaxID=166 RepID=UPI00298DEAD2|nr:YggT family protein [Treponema sp.]MCI6443021.1 YggT family protein [Spirochaetia bacterium]